MNNNEIDATARRKAAEVYRHFAAGLLTNDQMENSLPRSFESGLHEIFFCGIWPLYDDLHEHKLTGQYHLTPEGRHHVGRVILFLHSSLPYRWPRRTGLQAAGCALIALFTLGFYRPLRQRIRDCRGDEAVWPFFTRSEYQSALQHPPFLHGPKCA
ncbi:MAG TPA: hypothetical protein VIT91_03645 [Chthoniobacterales bacterium]